MSDVPFQCPSCGTRLRAGQALITRGASITCPKCQTLISLAGLAAPPALLAQAITPASDPAPEPEAEASPRPKKKKRPRPARRSQGNASVLVLVVLGLLGIGGLVAAGIWLLPMLTMSAHERALANVLACMEKVVSTTERITDRSTAEAMLPTLKKDYEALIEATKALIELENPTAEAEQALKAKFEPRMAEAQRRMLATATNLSKPEIATVLAPMMLELAQRQREQQGGRGPGGFGNMGIGPRPPPGPGR